jgi:F-type H+-transporting ATPase subunit epsilon
MASTKTLRCILVTPEKTIFEKDASFVVIPTFDGEIGVYPGHAPTVSRLGPGELRLVEGSERSHYFIDGGFAQIRSNVVSIMTSRVQEIADLDREKLERELAELGLTVQSSFSAEGQKERTDRLARVRAALRLAGK